LRLRDKLGHIEAHPDDIGMLLNQDEGRFDVQIWQATSLEGWLQADHSTSFGKAKWDFFILLNLASDRPME